ncbi:DUF2997 domain-containing protein [Mariniblastus fucicola]|uniref:DUF2997 domain-containing protein n=1 Tax=Mariniblastus fucicola TaxID=980251 RepID=A0A5B9PGQ2_9BACT|nr:DUF2997 domain-containing protein [Mariniblastus fucicola]QEG24779.1 hypothetical protein MFFC18_47020 [Mariniblastus fucicola]
MRTIEVTVSPDGQSKVEAIGYQGNTCREATKVFREALGASKTETKKPELYESQNQFNEQKESL